MLRLASKRLISTIELTSNIPPWLCIPIKSKDYSFSLNSTKTIRELIQEIQAEDKAIQLIQILDKQGQTISPELTCQELTTNEFQINIDGIVTDVLPGLSQFITGNEEHFSKCRAAGIPFNDARAICTFLKEMENLKDFSNFKEKAVEAFEKVRNYKEVEIDLLANQLNSYQKELDLLVEQQKNIESRAERYAHRFCQFGFSVMIIQWSGICYGTFFQYGWDIMEPVSYMIGASWAVLGYAYFLSNKTEFGLNSFKGIINRKRKNKLMMKEGFDQDRLELLKKNIENIKRMIEVTKRC